MTEQIISWSFSKAGDFQKCRFMTKLKHIDKIPEPERPLPPGKTEHANDRGSRIHDCAEQFVRGKMAFTPELREFRAEFEHLKLLFTKGKVTLEQEWAHDQQWNPAPWKTGWLRLKLDAMVHASPIEAVVIDYKTGRRFGNEVKHAMQTQLYALSAFLRFPELEVVHAELWYPDVKDLARITYTRDQGLRFKRTWDKQGHDITSCTTWPANPSIFTCQWCPYAPWTGPDAPCKVGVRR